MMVLVVKIIAIIKNAFKTCEVNGYKMNIINRYEKLYYTSHDIYFVSLVKLINCEHCE